MAEHIYAAFADPYRAESAVGALMDRGVEPEEITLVLSEQYRKARGTAADRDMEYVQPTITSGPTGRRRIDPLGNDLRNSGEVPITLRRDSEPGQAMDVEPADAKIPPKPSTHPLRDGLPESQAPGPEPWLSNFDPEHEAKAGVTTTTAADAEVGAAKGAGVGLGVGVLAGLVALSIPGFGLVLGGGALASAVAGLVATVGAGAVAGGAYGFLKDQGVPANEISHYREAYEAGGAIVSVAANSALPGPEVEELLSKYGAQRVGSQRYLA